MSQLEAVNEGEVARPGEFMRGLRDALPLMLGFIPFGLVLGAQAVSKDMVVTEVAIMTALNFGGGSEFAALALWTSPPHLALIVAVTFLVNSRHLLMGAVLAPYLRNMPARKAYALLFLMCDESWALSLADARRAGRFSLRYYLGVALGLYTSWVIFTAIGALAGPVLGNVERLGFDMAFPAVFLVMLAGMWKGPVAAFPWLVSLVCAGVTYVFAPGAWYVPVGALSGVVAAWVMAKP